MKWRYASFGTELIEFCLLYIFTSFSSFRRRNDSGFNSEIPSCGCGILPGLDGGVGIVSEHPSQVGLDFPSALLASDLNSGLLAQYGLNGPLDEYPGEEEDELDDVDGGGAVDLLDMPPVPSVTSVATKRKRKEEMKQATIRQHYYPEGGWGFVVVIVAVIVQIITHGLQLSFGILILAIKRRWPDAGSVQISEWFFLLFILLIFLVKLQQRQDHDTLI